MLRPIFCLSLLLALSMSATAASAPSLHLWRLDCGAVQVNDLNLFSDTFAYVGQSKRLTASCYLIQHNDTYMLWDTGLPEASLGASLSAPGGMAASLSRTLKDQLAEIKVSPASVSLIGISHSHWDHTGQAASFPQAKLLMGKGDVDALRKPGSE